MPRALRSSRSSGSELTSAKGNRGVRAFAPRSEVEPQRGLGLACLLQRLDGQLFEPVGERGCSRSAEPRIGARWSSILNGRPPYTRSVSNAARPRRSASSSACSTGSSTGTRPRPPTATESSSWMSVQALGVVSIAATDMAGAAQIRRL